jgi:transcriptional regulator with XRE-family HTH domain
VTTHGYIRPRDGLTGVDLTEVRSEPAKRLITDEHHRDLVEKALRRFVRNKTQPDDLEALRHRLIVARVANGLLATEAAERFGYANSTQLSLIESGARPVPKDFQFIAQAAKAYAVSADWLLGLAGDMEADDEILRRHALLRGTRDALSETLNGFARMTATVAAKMQLSPDETEDAIAGIESVQRRFRDLCERGQFEDLAGGAPVAWAISDLSRVVAPLRRVNEAFRSFNEYVGDVAAGRLPKIDDVFERCEPRSLAREVLGDG